MPARGALPSLSGWRCAQCTGTITLRSFTTSARQLAVGPEHPQYVHVPEPPQQNVPYRPPVKGTLPVPRNIFRGTSKELSSDEQIALSTQSPRRQKEHSPESREAWKVKMAEVRRRNLREGLKSLKTRQQRELRTKQHRSERASAKREQALMRPERDDERLTAPSNLLDLDALFNKSLPDPDREERLRRKRLNVEAAAMRKHQERMNALHSLYMNAREFIVTTQQLDKAVDLAFGSPENPVAFGRSMGPMDQTTGKSVWSLGKPLTISSMLARRSGAPQSRAQDDARSDVEVTKDRVRRMGEVFTGGKMDKEDRA